MSPIIAISNQHRHSFQNTSKAWKLASGLWPGPVVDVNTSDSESEEDSVVAFLSLLNFHFLAIIVESGILLFQEDVATGILVAKVDCHENR